MTRWRLACALKHLNSGGVIAYPTEAVYGLGCDPEDDEALERIYAMKSRGSEQGVILIAATMRQLDQVLGSVSADTLAQIEATWPGPVTWIVPVAADVFPGAQALDHTLAVRASAHPVAAELCRRFGGPLVSTSANRRGRPPARTAREVSLVLGRSSVDYVLNAPTGGNAGPSEIRDARTGEVLRAAVPAPSKTPS